jgi:tRNA 5-methylaminomethyl-2-thiouridine biosynthesis bifunctional protein
MIKTNKPTKLVAIIGAGIAGCSTAYALATRGIKVTLFEQATKIASAASGNPIGMLYPRLSGDNIESHFALAAYQHTLALYQSLGLGDNTFKQCGMLQLGFNARELARIEKVSAALDTSIGYFVSNTEASAIAGLTCQHPALYFPQAAWIKPQAVCEALIHHPNIDCQTISGVNNIVAQNDHYLISSNQQTIAFDSVVIANANDAAQFGLTAHLKTTPVRGQLTQVSATPSSAPLNTIICSDGYLSPAVDGVHSIGATFQTDDMNTAVTQQDHLANLAKVKVISQSLHDALATKVIGGRTAFRCVSQDRLPMVGELLNANTIHAAPPRPSATPSQLPWMKGLYVNIAHGSHGLISAPFTATLLAEMICDDTDAETTPLLLAHLNPNRFHLRSLGLKKLAKTVACSHA